MENKAKSGADLSELEAEAASLAKQYQKKLLRGYGSTKTDWNGKEMIDIKVFSETKEKIKVASRPDNQNMIICDEIPLEADVYAAEVDFAPYGVENYATFTAANIIETGWINSTNGNSLSYNLEVNGASSITYCIQNKFADKKQDNWSFTVTLHRRKLDIRMESRIVDYRYKGK